MPGQAEPELGMDQRLQIRKVEAAGEDGGLEALDGIHAYGREQRRRDSEVNRERGQGPKNAVR